MTTTNAPNGAQSLDQRVDYLTGKAREVRCRILDMIHKANSGHPGGSLSAADIVTALYFDFMRLNPGQPRWPDRDRFVLSKGHACPVMYACQAMLGYYPLETLDTLRQFESILQGHPIHKTPGVDMTTGSLGHGLSIGLGMALEARVSQRDFRVFVVLGDGETNEGHVWEAAAAAAKFRVDNLVAIVDRNRLQMDGFCEDVMPMGDLQAKFRAFGWQAMGMDGHDMRDIVLTIEKALLAKDGPVAIVAETVKGKGVSYMENVCEWHGRCPSDEEFTCAMDEMGGEA